MSDVPDWIRKMVHEVSSTQDFKDDVERAVEAMENYDDVKAKLECLEVEKSQLMARNVKLATDLRAYRILSEPNGPRRLKVLEAALAKCVEAMRGVEWSLQYPNDDDDYYCPDCGINKGCHLGHYKSCRLASTLREAEAALPKDEDAT